jgi:hypothetical protein
LLSPTFLESIFVSIQFTAIPPQALPSLGEFLAGQKGSVIDIAAPNAIRSSTRFSALYSSYILEARYFPFLLCSRMAAAANQPGKVPVMVPSGFLPAAQINPNNVPMSAPLKI